MVFSRLGRLYRALYQTHKSSMYITDFAGTVAAPSILRHLCYMYRNLYKCSHYKFPQRRILKTKIDFELPSSCRKKTTTLW